MGTLMGNPKKIGIFHQNICLLVLGTLFPGIIKLHKVFPKSSCPNYPKHQTLKPPNLQIYIYFWSNFYSIAHKIFCEFNDIQIL